MGVYDALEDPGEGQVALRSTISIAVVASVWLSAITVQGAGAIATTNAGAIRGEVDWYDRARLTERGVVVVTLNYRLGALGFLARVAQRRNVSHSA